MPYRHNFPLRVRHYECDANEQVHHANYLRYMQEAAFDASAAVGYSAQRYAEIGLQWLAYETEITFLKPLHYSDDITIKTWVHDFRRVRSLRQYEFYRADEQIAHATTDWVLINTQTNYPASIPQAIIDAYSQGDPVEQAPPRQPFIKLPPLSDSPFSADYRIGWRDIDAAQHVNNAVYLHYATDCGSQALAHFGWDLNGDSQPMLSRWQIEYKYPAVYDDTIRVTTWLSDLTEHDFLRHFTIKRATDDKLLTRIVAHYGWMNRQHQAIITTPSAFREMMAVHSTTPTTN